ncbi:related to RIX7-AAA-type ATPase required for biogenesis and nuclear export of 60S ribosomal subunits [Serendipita indica DSM 11827]|uniref:Related to RIX7-AAA-type ATPase required for biogenesis and nuclear export of 60S ribosomal subunits n=1 Tax=Serendipita indica (strain DSM 11827) TaxID=1109443 RepID=G4TAE9_SERID|nr:related to RIX7-AAA-type ATPase required for biogenesis and nuclear export of 60S ribosomal subunits [Serendipita indica DSM 11827]
MSLNQKMMAQWASSRKINLNATPPVVISETDGGAELKVGDQSKNIPESKSTNETPVETPTSTARKRKPTFTRDEFPSKKPKGSAATAKTYPPPSIRLSDLGGVQNCVEKLLELVAMPLRHPEIYLHTGVQPPRGVLLHGPPGCGKTLLANAIAGELQVPFISISAPSIVSGMSGESEKTLRETFEEAKKNAPCILFIDEIDAITPKRESAQREMERRIVAQFLTCMDDLSWDKTDDKAVMIIGATNRPDSLDAALRRAGRFDHEIGMNVPDEEGRVQILKVLCAKLRLDGDFDFKSLARQTPGYVGADLAALTGAAGVIAVKRIFQEIADGKLQIPTALEVAQPDETMLLDGVDDPTEKLDNVAPSTFSVAQLGTMLPTSSPTSSSLANFLMAYPLPLTPEQLEPLHITFADFETALPTIQPSSKREGFATIPDVTWADVGALHGVREELHMTIVQPILRPELFRSIGIDAPGGVLLWGPPGCGKTLLAKAVANESRANFISVKGPELLNKYVGESERALRQVFSRARASSPCIIFFDELDALVPRRDDSLSESSARVVNTLLTELDGLDSRKGVHVIAATNRPDMIDPAMCRPGRLDKLLYVDLPTPDERVEIFKALARRLPIQEDELVQAAILDFVHGERFEGFSGADLAALVREAGVTSLRRTITAWESVPVFQGAEESGLKVIVSYDDFDNAAKKIGPSVSAAQRRKYEALRSKFAGAVPTVKVPEDGVVN